MLDALLHLLQPGAGHFVNTNGQPIDWCPDLQYAFADLAADGEIVAAVTGRRIRVVQMVVVVSAAMTFRLQSSATSITANWSLAANGGLVLPFSQVGWCQTAVGEALNGDLGAVGNAAVQVGYVTV